MLVSGQISRGGAGQGSGFDSFPAQGLAVFNAFYRTGALVFGGGHVVLPLLEGAVVARGWVDQASFLSGYGAAQALPGPLFTLCRLPGRGDPAQRCIRWRWRGWRWWRFFFRDLLIMVAVLPFWNELRQRPQIQAMFRGVNAAVVGVLIVRSSVRCGAAPCTRASTWWWRWWPLRCWCAGNFLRGSSSWEWHRLRLLRRSGERGRAKQGAAILPEQNQA